LPKFASSRNDLGGNNSLTHQPISNTSSYNTSFGCATGKSGSMLTPPLPDGQLKHRFADSGRLSPRSASLSPSARRTVFQQCPQRVGGDEVTQVKIFLSFFQNL